MLSIFRSGIFTYNETKNLNFGQNPGKWCKFFQIKFSASTIFILVFKVDEILLNFYESRVLGSIIESRVLE